MQAPPSGSAASNSSAKLLAFEEAFEEDTEKQAERSPRQDQCRIKIDAQRLAPGLGHPQIDRIEENASVERNLARQYMCEIRLFVKLPRYPSETMRRANFR